MTISISFADNSASNAWDKLNLGEFDPESEVATQIDTDGDGSITEAEIQAYQTTLTTSDEDALDYSMVDLADEDIPEGFIEMSEIMNSAIKAFSDMTEFVKKLVDDVITAISAATEEAAEEVNSATSSIDAAGKLTQVSTDIDTTEGSVDKILDKVNNSVSSSSKGSSFRNFLKSMFGSLFKSNNSGNEADIAKINQLGGEAKAGAKFARAEVAEAREKLDISSVEPEDLCEEQEPDTLDGVEYRKNFIYRYNSQEVVE